MEASDQRADTLRAAGLAIAALAANAIAAVFTIVFARKLGADGYGSLAALVSSFLVLSVPGSALQVAVARDTVLGRLGSGPALAATIDDWTRRVAFAALALTAIAALASAPLADIVGVEERWAAAATLPTGALWLLLGLQRGALQGVQHYRAVGLSIVLEATGRLVFGLGLVTVAGVTGAYLGVPLAMLATALVLRRVLHARTGASSGRPTLALGALLRDARLPIAGLTLVAVLQNLDVIIVRHQIDGDPAGSYAAAAVAAKVVVWTAVGLALYLLPEATRRAAAGQDARPVLARTLALVGVVALPMLALFAVASHTLLERAFGADLAVSSGALPWLGLAMSLLAGSYLAVQFLLALGRRRFLYVLALGAIAEPLLLLAAGDDPTTIAATLAALQLVVAVAMLTLAARAAATVVARPARGPTATAP